MTRKTTALWLEGQREESGILESKKWGGDAEGLGSSF
jgi:hypothetical protein